MLTQIQSIPYELELRDTLDAALAQFALLKTSAADVIRLQDANRAMRRTNAEIAGAQKNAQTRLFDALEAFLTSFARVSLLVFPLNGSAFREERGRTMQCCLAIDDTSPLGNRGLRDSWMHHDERMDDAVVSGRGANGQRFSRSTENPEKLAESFLRVIEADTLRVHYRERNGAQGVADLYEIHRSLSELDHRRDGAFDVLELGEPGPTGADADGAVTDAAVGGQPGRTV